MVPEGLGSSISTWCIMILVSLAVRASIAAWDLSSSLLPMPKTWLTGEVPQDWPAERSGAMSQDDTLSRPSFQKRHTSLVYWVGWNAMMWQAQKTPPGMQ